jgi:GDP-L-fucose synthase
MSKARGASARTSRSPLVFGFGRFFIRHWAGIDCGRRLDDYMKLLITGGSGFIGRNLVEHFAGRYAVSAPLSSELDLLDAIAVRRYLCANHFDVIVHAATTRSNRRLGAPADMLDRNCRMFFNLVRNDGLFGKMIHFGSGAEYDRTGLPTRVREDYFGSSVPKDPYGFSKYICAKYIERCDRIVDLRLFGVFGKYEDYTVRFLSNACCRALKGLPITIRQDVIFDYLYVNDLARITEWFIEHEAHYKAYNVCTGEGVALTQLAGIVAEVCGQNSEVTVKTSGLAPGYTADNSLLLNEMGGYEFSDIRSCINDLYTWYVGQKQTIDFESLGFDR